jgi:recombination protein RecA
MYNEGISVSGDVLDNGVIYKVINKSGNSYSYKEDKLGVGRETAKKFLRDNPKLLKSVSKDIWEVVEKGEAPEEESGNNADDEVPPPTEE